MGDDIVRLYGSARQPTAQIHSDMTLFSEVLLLKALTYNYPHWLSLLNLDAGQDNIPVHLQVREFLRA